MCKQIVCKWVHQWMPFRILWELPWYELHTYIKILFNDTLQNKISSMTLMYWENEEMT
jgi:hypothetical protein